MPEVALTGLIFLQAGVLLLVLLQDDGPSLSWPETLATAFGLGVGALTFELMLMGVASIPFQLALVLAPWAIAWPIVAFGARARLTRVLRTQAIPSTAARPTNREDYVIAILFCLLAGLVLIVFVHAALFPLEGWDEWIIWDLKARAFWIDGGIKPFVGNSYLAIVHLDYPLLTPLAGTLFYLVAGGTPHGIVQVIPATFFLCSLTQFAAALRRWGASTLWTVASTAALACLPPLLSSALVFLAESPSVYYVLTSTIYLALYLRDERPLFLRLAAISAGFATQVRVEVVVLFVAPLALLLIKRAWTASAQYAGILAALFLPWTLAARFITAPEGRELNRAGELLHSFTHLPSVLATMGYWTLSPRHLGPFILLLPLVVILLLTRWQRLFRDPRATWLLIAAIWAPAPYVGFLAARPEANYPDAMGRYLVVFIVLVYLFVTTVLIDTSPRLQRLALAAGGVSLTLWMGADLLGWMAPPTFFHRWPIESARAVLTQAETLSQLTPVQRILRLEQSYGRTGFAGMLPALISQPLPSGDVIVFSAPNPKDGGDGSYVHMRLAYLLYPHHVYVIDNEAALERAMAARPAALVVYATRPPLDRVAGEVTYAFAGRYAVIRAPRLRP